MPARAAPSVTVDQERLRPEASSGFDNGLGGGKNFELGRAIFWPSCPQTALRIAQPKRKGPPERPMVPKAQWLLLCLASWLRTDWLAAAGLMLALHWPSGPWPLDLGLWTSVPSDACHCRLWSAIGTRHCWRGMVREDHSINRHRSNTQFPTWSRRNIRFLQEI
jgi:hypothetical protein